MSTVASFSETVDIRLGEVPSPCVRVFSNQEGRHPAPTYSNKNVTHPWKFTCVQWVLEFACDLPAGNQKLTANGSTSGSCASGYGGSCSYTCTNGTWTQSSNTCSSCPTLTADYCEDTGYDVQIGYNHDIYEIGCVSPASLEEVPLLDLESAGSVPSDYRNYCINPSAVSNTQPGFCTIGRTPGEAIDVCQKASYNPSCTTSNTFSSGDYVSWVCKCGNQKQVCNSLAFSGRCVNSGNGCSSGRDELVICPNADSNDKFDPNRDLGPPNGPSAHWHCRSNYIDGNIQYGQWCDYAAYPEADICCNAGWRCDGSTLKEYKKCSATGTTKTCTHGCWDPSSNENTLDSKCHACTTDSDCTSKCSGGKVSSCSTSTNGWKSCGICTDTALGQ